MGSGGGLFDERSGSHSRQRFRPFLLETSTLLHAFRLLARVFVVGSFTVIFLVLGSLLHGELARAWASETRRIVKRDQS